MRLGVVGGVEGGRTYGVDDVGVDCHAGGFGGRVFGVGVEVSITLCCVVIWACSVRGYSE